jgi:hypothetical protein
LAFIKEVLSNASSYYIYEVEDSDTPEILANKVYGNPEAGWIILYANNILDPQFGWPLNDVAFNQYIINKYTTVDNAKTLIHHYEKVIRRTNITMNVTTETRIEVNYTKLTNNDMNDPYDYYTGLPATQSVSVYEVGDDTIEEVISRDAISCYDWEVQENDKKRIIKIIKSEYYSQIMSEFRKLTGETQNYLRRLS